MYSANQKLLGKKIADCRKRRNLTQAALGKLTGMNATTISNYEIGYSIPRIDKLQLIADALSENISYFIKDDEINVFRVKTEQKGFYQNTIPFYKNSNIDGMLNASALRADSYMELPSVDKHDTRYLIGTAVGDNSLINSGLPAGSYIIISRNKIPKSGNTVAVIDNRNKILLIRKMIKDGPLTHLTANGYGTNTPIITRDNDTDYTILGTVVGKMLKFEFLDM